MNKQSFKLSPKMRPKKATISSKIGVNKRNTDNKSNVYNSRPGKKNKKNIKTKTKSKSLEVKKITYKNSGVDVDAGDRLVDWLQQSSVQQKHAESLVEGIGGFASLFKLDFAKYKKPCLVTCTDGVGTKVKLASYFKDYSGVGQDLVAMCVNDLICTGGDPLLFLDYYATGKLDLTAAKAFLASVRKACFESDCALVGGETAEMPGVYQKNDFDCAGFAVGIVDEDQTLGKHRVKSGDILIGVSSSGFHSNGYSLLRKVFSKDLRKWKRDLLKPTALYVKLAKALRAQTEVHALAHITGGGVDNIPRVIPDNLKIKLKDWQWPKIFDEVQKRSGISRDEMKKTLNCGIGLVVIAPLYDRDKIFDIIRLQGFKAYDLGGLSS